MDTLDMVDNYMSVKKSFIFQSIGISFGLQLCSELTAILSHSFGNFKRSSV